MNRIDVNDEIDDTMTFCLHKDGAMRRPRADQHPLTLE